MVKQYIYKVSIDSDSLATGAIGNDELRFFHISKVMDLFSHYSILVNHFGFSKALLKVVFKAILAKKMLYFTSLDGVIVSDGEVTFGECNHYPINKKDCVIGPVNTKPGYQGKGIATFSLHACMAKIAALKIVDYIYIDTKEDNFAMQKVIAKVGFKDKVGSYQRSGDL